MDQFVSTNANSVSPSQKSPSTPPAHAGLVRTPPPDSANSPLSIDNVNGLMNPDIRNQLEQLQRTVTLVFWYKPNTEPIRLQHMIPTFPLFQLARFPSLTSDLGLTPTTYLDTYNRDTRQWDQHTISSVRIVDGNQRLLYRIRKSLLEGLNEDECLGLREEVDNQARPRVVLQGQLVAHGVGGLPTPTSPALGGASVGVGANGLNGVSGADSFAAEDAKARSAGGAGTKRAAPSGGADGGPPSKMYVLERFGGQQQPYPAYLSAPVASPHQSQSQNGDANGTHAQLGTPPDERTASSANATPPDASNGANANTTAPTSPYHHTLPRTASSSASPTATTTTTASPQYLYQSPLSYTTSPAPGVSIPSYLIHPHSSAPMIPYHPHPPLKRWPNDYTVSELSRGFAAMDALVHHAPVGSLSPHSPSSSSPQSALAPHTPGPGPGAGPAMTQRVAFERVFGSRYVKSTVCRHRGLWRKAPQALREEFERMGEDERACWGEFVRRVEGRPPGRVGSSVAVPVHEAMMVRGQGSQGQGQGSANASASAGGANGNVQVQVQARAEEEEEDADEMPVMDSLQHPNQQDTPKSPTMQHQSQNQNQNASMTVYVSSLAPPPPALD